MFFPSNLFVKASYTKFGVLNTDTWGMRWSLIESTMILLWSDLASSPSGSGTSPVIKWSSHVLQGSRRLCTSILISYQPLQDCPQYEYGKSYFQMRNSNVNRRFRSYLFEVSNLVPELADLGFVKQTLVLQTWSLGILFWQKYVPPWGELLSKSTF